MKLFALAAAALSVTVAGAAADPLEQRQANMKERGQVMRILGPIAQGRADFDAAAVNEALAKLETNAEAAADVDALWPQGSDTGDTKAASAIWDDFDAYKAENEKYAQAVAAAVAAAPQDLAAFQAAFGPVGGSCGSCHEKYRNE
ncbi:MAG: cytochrome c [Aquamicrobium sp.]|uniref:c-type cytochrome n=1 Tax=Aquamicrobium sp. TaxID=1872579 RepID=UPI00349EE506|nr:cytochrome c [Aquamicrobium sp.]